MNVLIIGSGGREHALAYKISKSDKLDRLFISPGNPGTAQLGKNVELNLNEENKVVEFCNDNKIDLVVVGPEIPLVDGIADVLRKNNIAVFGPDKGAAMIEGDKSFSKELMKKYDIPTAAFKVFADDSKAEAEAYLSEISYPTVIKASGLAAGKGVLICENKAEAEDALNSIFEEKEFGDAGNTIVIEEFMVGQEASLFAITDGDDYVLLPAAQDHKRIFDGDKGKNTGGMGAYTPAPIATHEIIAQAEEKIIKPTLAAMKAEGKKYNGCLYAGLMITEEGPKVVEFNCRFGDPETQVVLPVLDGDLLELLHSAAKGKINKEAVSYSGKSAVCVVAASEGYPGSYKKGFVINGLNEAESDNVVVFHAGTKESEGNVVTSGGRVLGVTAINDEGNIGQSKLEAYNALNKICFEGIYFRKDISDKAL